MSDKLLTLEELSAYLKISETKVNELVKDGVISAYKIGGEMLRFRIEQIDAIREEIDSMVKETDKINISEARQRVKDRFLRPGGRVNATFFESVADFFYFNDFYIFSALLIVVLLGFIFRG
jgi:excisionase family DNA binding protein